MNTPRVALVTNILSHYRVPGFQLLAEKLSGKITFYVLTEKMEHRRYVQASSTDGLPVVPLQGWTFRRPRADDIHLNNVAPILGGKYEIFILGGWSEPTYLMLWACAQVARKKFLFWIESTAYDLRRGGGKERLKRLLLKRASGCIVPGTRAAEYCMQLGVPDYQIFVAPNSTDRNYFQTRAERLLPLRERLRAELGLNGTAFLFVGRFVDEFKDVFTLLKAFHELQNRGIQATLILAGDGPDRSLYQRWIQENSCVNIKFTGLLDHEQLCKYYASSDVLVLPSKSEPWGFVLNEAMEFGLPLIVSSAVGAGPDLVKSGLNGYGFTTGDSAELAEKMARLAADPTLQKQFGGASRSIIEHFSPAVWADAVASAIHASLS